MNWTINSFLVAFFLLHFHLPGAIGIAYAQDTFLRTNDDQHFRDGLELFQKENFAAAREKFNQYADLVNEGEKTIQAFYYMAVCALKLKHQDFEKSLLEFTANYPAHPKTKSVFAILGGYYFESGDYKMAIFYLTKSDFSRLQTEEDIQTAYQLAYAYMQQGSSDRAARIFNTIKGGAHPYAAYASYYAGYLAYEKGDYEGALNDLNKSSKDARLRTDSFVLIASINYKIGDYDQVISLVEEMEQQGVALPLEVYQVVGDSYFIRENYSSASRYLDYFVKNSRRAIDRKTYYRLGFANFKIENLNTAVKYLSDASDGFDTLAQVSSYHLGISYVALNQKPSAVAAFDKCRRLDFDKRMQELGAYYFVKVNFDVADFVAVTEGSDFYQKRFPEGPNLQEVATLASEAYLNTGDYTRALDEIEKISNKTQKIKAAYQKIAFNKAVEDYNDGKFRLAVNMLNKSLTYPVSNALVSAAYYWLAEIYAYGNRYDSALINYQKLKVGTLEYDKALYGSGYAYYNTKRYQEAIPYFRDFIQQARGVDQEKKIDALVRLGDCYFITGGYENALNVYNAALQNNSPDRNHIHFQKAMTYKAYNRINDAIASLDEIIGSLSISVFADRAYYHKGLIYADNGRIGGAVDLFSQVIQNFPNSSLYPYALSERALAYERQGFFQQAVNDYKAILAQSLSGELAQSAFRTLQSFANRGIAVPDLASIEMKYQQANPEDDAIFDFQLQRAKEPFNQDNYPEAIRSLQAFLRELPPQAMQANEARYFLGYSFELNGQPREAIEAYKLVQGEYQLRALRNMARQQLNTGDYSEAITTYSKLVDVADRKRTLVEAYQGLMRAFFELQDYSGSLIYAGKIIEENVLEFRNEAFLYQGKVALAQMNYEDALVKLQYTVSISQDANGAQAQYLVGLCLREMGRLEESIQACIEVRQKFLNYSEWVYRAFLLVAENYIDMNNAFQAKATLRSIIEYSDDPAFKEMASRRLEQISN